MTQDIGDDLARRLAGIGVRQLRQSGLRHDVDPGRPRIGRHRVHAAPPRAGHDPPHAVGGQHRHERPGTHLALIISERASGLVGLLVARLGAIPHRPLDGAGVPHQHEGPGIELAVLPQVHQAAQ